MPPFIERPPLIAPLPADVQSALSRLRGNSGDETRRGGSSVNPVLQGTHESYFTNKAGVEGAKRIVAGLPQDKYQNHSSREGKTPRRISTGAKDTFKTTPDFISTLGIDVSFESGFSLEAAHSIYTALIGKEEGLGNLVQIIGEKNSGERERISDLKANAFEDLGLGQPRREIAEKELVSTTERIVEEIRKSINRYDVSEEDLKDFISDSIDRLCEEGVDPKGIAALGLIGSASIIAGYVGSKNGRVQKALIAVTLLLSACSPAAIPDTQKDLPTPRVEVSTPLPVTQTPEAPTPTTDYGLNVKDEGGENWPGIGIEPFDYIQQRLESNLPVLPAVDVPEAEWERFEAENPGAQVDELVSAIKQKLLQQGIKDAKLTVVKAGEGMGGGWAVEIRAKDSSLMWARITDEAGLERWAEHPDLIPSDGKVRFEKIEGSENMELVVAEGNAIGVEIENGEIVGVFQPLLDQIAQIKLAQLGEVPSAVGGDVEVETPVSVALDLGYSDEDCNGCVIRESIPDTPGVRKELWNDQTGVMAYWTVEKGWESTKGWAEVLKSDPVYSGEGFAETPIQRSGRIYHWRVVLDGESVETPYKIADSQGTIFENIYSTYVYYLDNQGRLASALVPHVVKVNGQDVVLNAADLIFAEVYGLKTPKDIVNKLKEVMVKGKNLYFILRPNEFVSGGKIPWGDWSEDIRDLWNRYQVAYRAEYQAFLDTAVAPQVVIPLTYGGDFVFNENFVNLP